MISFNPEWGGIVAPFPSFLLAQRANLRRSLVLALTTLSHQKTKVILFSSTRVSQAWGKSHHPWRTTEGGLEGGPAPLPPPPHTTPPPSKHAAGIRDGSSSPSIPSAVLPYVQYQTHQIDAERFRFVPHLQIEISGCQWDGYLSTWAAPWQSNLSRMAPHQPPALHPPSPLSDSSRHGKMMVGPASVFNFTPLCVHKALLITNRPRCASEWKAKPLISSNLITKMRADKKQPPTSSIVVAGGCPFELRHLPQRKSLPLCLLSKHNPDLKETF